jgi:branched-chain amino acid transport system substrate-binding protein
LRARWIGAAVCLVALAAVVSACGSSSNKSGGAATISGSTLTIYASVPLQGSAGDQGKTIENGAKLAIDSTPKIGKYTIKYVPLDDSLASTGAADEGKGSQNARQAISDKTSVGYIGEYNSGISKVTIPINNQGGLAQVSPANTKAGLTTKSVPGVDPGEPDKYYPTGKRNYARVVPIDTVQAAALLITMKQDGCKSVHIWNSKTAYSAGLATNVVNEAKKTGIKIEGNDGYDIKAANYRSLAANVHSDCFLNTGEAESNGNQALKDVAVTHPTTKIYESDGDCLNVAADPAKGVPSAVAGRFKCTIATLDPKSFGPEGTAFFNNFKKTFHVTNPDTYAIYGYEAASLLLDSIKRASANGTKDISREDVVNALFQTKNRHSVIGTYSIDSEGDTSLTDYGLYRIDKSKLTFDRVIKASQLLPQGAKHP